MIERLGLTGMNRVSSAAATTMSRITTRIKLAMPQRNNPSEPRMSCAVLPHLRE